MKERSIWGEPTKHTYQDKINTLEKRLDWAMGVISRYEARLQEQANSIRRFEATATARAEGREPTWAELNSFRHIETERYEHAE